MASTTAEMLALVWCQWSQFVLLAAAYKRLRRKKRKTWIREVFRRREARGLSGHLIRELREHDNQYYYDVMRITPALFDKLISLIYPDADKTDNGCRNAIPTHDKLTITLRFLATGETFENLSFSFRMRKSTIVKIIKETCQAIWSHLKDEYVKMPKIPEEWLKISSGFNKRWQLPHCCGCIDAKHVCIQRPDSQNYKRTTNNILFAVCDSKYRFILVDFGHYGSNGDGSILQKSELGKHIQCGNVNLPSPNNLPNSTVTFPYYFVGDEAFPLRCNLMRPYPKRGTINHETRIYNYRLGRVKQVTENAFGILSTRFRIYRQPLEYCDSSTKGMVAATIALHNFLMMENGNIYCPAGFVDHEDDKHNLRLGSWRCEVGAVDNTNPRHFSTNMYPRDAKIMRDTLAKYLCQEGSVPWQESINFSELLM